SAGGHPRMDFSDSRNLQAGGSRLPVCLRVVFVLCVFRIPGKAGLADCRKAHRDSESAPGFGLSGYVDGADRDDHCSVAVLLSSGGLRGEEGWSTQYPQARADVIFGSISCMLIVFFIIVCTAATLYVSGHRDINDAGM